MPDPLRIPFCFQLSITAVRLRTVAVPTALTYKDNIEEGIFLLRIVSKPKSKLFFLGLVAVLLLHLFNQILTFYDTLR